jgi:hypothetical protein
MCERIVYYRDLSNVSHPHNAERTSYRLAPLPPHSPAESIKNRSADLLRAIVAAVSVLMREANKKGS